MDTFIFVRRIGFLFDNDIRVRGHKVFVIERDMTDDAQSVGDNAKLEDTAKMLIDIQLLNDSVSVLGIVFGDKGFNTGRSKDGHIRICRIYGLADGRCNISKLIKYGLQIL